MAKLTREEKQAAADAKRAADKLADSKARMQAYQARVRKFQEMPVISKSQDVFKLTASVSDYLFGKEREAELLYNAIERVERARSEFASEVGWLRSAMEDAERALQTGAYYSSHIVGARGTALDSANAALHVATQAAKDVCRMLGVYCTLLQHPVTNEKHMLCRSLAVLASGGGWAVRCMDPAGAATWLTGEGTFEPNGMCYDTEDAAWRAVAAVLGDLNNL